MNANRDVPAVAAVPGDLDPVAPQRVRTHLWGCRKSPHSHAEHLEVQTVPTEVPLEMLLDRPPDAKEPLEQANGATDAERNPPRRDHGRRPAVVTTAALVFACLLSVLNGLIDPFAASMPSVSRTLSATDLVTGVSVSMTIADMAGVTRFQGQVIGVPSGTACVLIVELKSGNRVLAGSMRTTPGSTAGTLVNGSAAARSSDISAIEIDTDDGQRLVRSSA